MQAEEATGERGRENRDGKGVFMPFVLNQQKT